MKLGIDLGGTKIEALVLDGHKERWRKRVATPRGNYEKTLHAISGLVTEAKQACGIASDQAFGIGTPGALTKSACGAFLMKNCNSVVLNGKPLRDDLERILGCTVYMANDANCFALAETFAGVGKSKFGGHTPESVFGVILGTGVGGGVVVNGQILHGLHSIAGEWGHNCLPAKALGSLTKKERNRECYCGRKDCIETYLSGPGIALSYQLRYGEKLTSEEIVSRMRDRDSNAKDIWQRYLSQLAASLSQIVNVLDPALVVLGGGMSNISEIYTDINELMKEHVFTEHAETPVMQADLGDSAGVYGAAWLTNEAL